VTTDYSTRFPEKYGAPGGGRLQNLRNTPHPVHQEVGRPSPGARTEPTKPGPTTWHGWLWTGCSWELVCSEPTMADCHVRLGELARQRGIPAKYRVMTGGKAPTFVPTNAAQAARGIDRP
jgi:hypothetical protein